MQTYRKRAGRSRRDDYEDDAPQQGGGRLSPLITTLAASAVTALIAGAITWGTIQAHLLDQDRRLSLLETTLSHHLDEYHARLPDLVSMSDYRSLQAEMRDQNVSKSEFRQFETAIERTLEDIRTTLADQRHEAALGKR